jgi:general secretion pathway protein K
MKEQRGAALITVMFLVAMAAILAFGLLSRQQLDIRRTAGLVEEAQAYEYVLGAEAWARQMLANDAALSPGVDYPGQDWAKLHDAMPVEHGSLTLFIEDLQGRFNINTLVGDAGGAATQFTRLLSLLNLPSDLAPAIIARINTPENFDPATGTAHFIASVTFLRTVEGVTPEIYATLAPYLAALPDRRPSLNVNTASDIVLKAFIPNERLYDLVIQSRNQQGFFNRQQLRTMGMRTPVFSLMHNRGITVGSNYFCVTAQARIEGHGAALSSIIERTYDKDGTLHLHVISRDRSPIY